MPDTTLTFQFSVDGTPTNVTLAVLEDPTDTFGVKRVDTDAVVVAAGTAMVHQGTGVYSYTFSDPSPGLVYSYYVKYVYDGATFFVPFTKGGNVDGASESSLALTFDELREAVSVYLNFGPYSSASASQKAAVNRCINVGLRWFYYPARLPSQRRAHEWMFLRPVAQLTTLAGQEKYDLPASFGGIEGAFTFQSSNDGWWKVPLIPEADMRAKKQGVNDVTSRPMAACLRPKMHNGAAGQRWEVEFWPKPAAEYVLSYRYNVLPNALTTEAPFPWGGAQHAETIRAACLAAAESEIHDSQGEKYNRFIERLQASIDYDVYAATPERMGYHGDPSMPCDDNVSVRRSMQPMTYDGIIWDS